MSYSCVNPEMAETTPTTMVTAKTNKKFEGATADTDYIHSSSGVSNVDYVSYGIKIARSRCEAWRARAEVVREGAAKTRAIWSPLSTPHDIIISCHAIRLRV